MDVDGGSSGRFRYRYRFQRPSSAFIVSKSLDCLVKHEFLIWLLKWNNRKLCSVTCFRKRNNKKVCSVKYIPSSERTRLQSWFISVQPRVRKERHGVGAKNGLQRRELCTGQFQNRPFFPPRANPGAFDFFEKFWSNYPLCCQFWRSNELQMS